MKKIWIVLGICLIAMPILEVVVETINHSYKMENIILTTCLGCLGISVLAIKNKMFSRVNKNYFYH